MNKVSVKIKSGTALLEGDLILPKNATGIVLFAHGSGSSRFSPRNRFVAKSIQSKKLGTLLFDLLTHEEEEIDLQTAQYRFDIPLLAKRLVDATDWLCQQKPYQSLNLGYFGSSTGAGAALIAAAERPAEISAVVSRGGRPDLAGPYLEKVKAPTLLIVGGLDTTVIELNQKAQEKLPCENHLEIVPGASHLFEEPGALEAVTDLACTWFLKNLGR